MLGSLAISLPSEESWNSALLILNAKWISEDDQLEEKTVEVIHASRPSHVAEHAQWISERLRGDVQDGPDLWNRRAELFPSLTFCEVVSDQIQLLSPTMLRPCCARGLFKLEAYCRDWSEGGFDQTQLATKATPWKVSATLESVRDRKEPSCVRGARGTYF